MTTTTGIKLKEETKNRLRELGKEYDRSPHWLMKQAIESYLNREEEKLREKKLLDARWEHYKRTGQGVDHSEVEKWLNKVAKGKRVKPSWLV